RHPADLAVRCDLTAVIREPHIPIRPQNRRVLRFPFRGAFLYLTVEGDAGDAVCKLSYPDDLVGADANGTRTARCTKHAPVAVRPNHGTERSMRGGEFADGSVHRHAPDLSRSRLAKPDRVVRTAG